MEMFDISEVGTIVLGLGAVQAIIGVLVKLDLKGVKLLLAAFFVVTLVRVAWFYSADYEVAGIIFQGLFYTLAAAGFWRYRNGEQPALDPEDPELTQA